MLLENLHQFCQRLSAAAAADEPLCLICHEPVRNHLDPDVLLGSPVCRECRRKFKPVHELYCVDGIRIRVLQEYTPFLEQLFFQFKEGCDIALAPVFLQDARLLRKHSICVLPSWWEKSLSRGFEPVPEILAAHGISCTCPFVKTDKVKQSSLSRKGRTHIGAHLEMKDHGSVPDGAVLVDDVCTTGSTLLAACRLSGIRDCIVLAVHPQWRKEHEKDRIVRGDKFWRDWFF